MATKDQTTAPTAPVAHGDEKAAAKAKARQNLGDALRAKPNRTRPTPPATLATELELRRWELEQQKIEDDYRAASAKFPPGSKLFVSTARGIKSRRRAGLGFSDQGREEVAVVDLTDDELAKVRAGNDDVLGTVDGENGERNPHPLAVRIRSGLYVVGPMGAKAISEDDGLAVWSEEGASADKMDGRDEMIAELQRKIAERDAVITKLRQAGRAAGNPAAPTRLPAGTSPGSAPGGGDFGDDGKPAK